jgi:hypothetical protein
MTCRQIKPEHALIVQRAVGRHLSYAAKLRRRLELLRFPPDDPLMVSATQAYHALHELHVRLHYLGCRHGVGETSR